MPVCYDKLFHLMIDRHMTNAQLMTTRLKKNEYISLESIEKLCFAMKCSVDDILVFRENKNDKSE